MQFAYTFDEITKEKILRGALIALTGSAALGLLDYVGALKIDNLAVAAFVSWLVPTLVNVVKEWMAGETNIN